MKKSYYKRQKSKVDKLKIKFGLSPEQFDELYLRQNGRCAICKEPTEKPCVDHCHRTGKVRALLCHQCNLGLGLFRENPRYLAQAIIYLENHGLRWTQWSAYEEDE